MDKVVRNTFFALVRSAIEGEPLSPEASGALTDECVREVLRAAKKQDVGAMVAHALDRCGYRAEDAALAAMVDRELFVATFRYEQQQYELSAIRRTLSEQKIPHLPLKGSVLREHYAEPWMRTSCDIDVLVQEEDLLRAVEALVTHLGYERGESGSHDVSLFSKTKVHLELHFNLNEPKCKEYITLSNVWSYAKATQEDGYTYAMDNAVMYFYHIAHMAKHFENGGCGVRPFLDLWIMDRLVQTDVQRRDALLREEGLLPFADAARALSAVWMDGSLPTPLTERMEEYLLTGGVYGSVQNVVLVGQSRRGGRFGYLLSKVFLPYDALCFEFPVLRGKRWLTPLMQLRRWGRILFRGGVRRAAKKLAVNARVSTDARDATAMLLDEIGLGSK